VRIEAFDFPLPPERIAQVPAEPRDTARLLSCLGGRLDDRGVLDLPDLLLPGDLLVVNDTRVLPARLTAMRGEAKIDLTLHQDLSLLTPGQNPRLDPLIAANRWLAFAKPAKKCRPGDQLVIGPRLTAEVLARDGGEVALAFTHDFDHLTEALEAYGAMPLPPYIKRAGKEAADEQRYQTLFADRPGAVAAPTAGLHFTPRLMAALARRGVGSVQVTLHVGAGTFLPVKVEDTRDHVMHSEWCEVSEATAEALLRTRQAGGRIVAVGTTSLRTLEATQGQPGCIDTDIFITPGYDFGQVDLLLTNFHLPKSTLFMLVSAFTSLDFMQRAYAHAIAQEYRFFSYGDACLLERLT
jgi:S-adenosylmethionine:tRNA ribosyltransferase-isomerase